MSERLVTTDENSTQVERTHAEKPDIVKRPECDGVAEAARAAAEPERLNA